MWKNRPWIRVFLDSKERTNVHMAQPDPCHIPTPLLNNTDLSPASYSIQEQRFQCSDSIFPFRCAQHSSFHRLNIASLTTRGNRGRVKDKHVDGGGKKERGFIELGGAIFRAECCHWSHPNLHEMDVINTCWSVFNHCAFLYSSSFPDFPRLLFLLTNLQ